MFTKFEIEIMATALERYMGIYGYGQYQNLTEEEKRKHKKSLDVAQSLSDRFREIQMEDYQEHLKVEELVTNNLNNR